MCWEIHYMRLQSGHTLCVDTRGLHGDTIYTLPHNSTDPHRNLFSSPLVQQLTEYGFNRNKNILLIYATVSLNIIDNKMICVCEIG